MGRRRLLAWRTPKPSRDPVGRARRRPGRARAALLALLLAGCASTSAYDPDWALADGTGGESSEWTKEQKLLALNAATTAIIAAYGLQFWDYGGQGWKWENEGWFGKNTQYGGADKVGHAYTAYLATLGYAYLYERWGYDRDRADLYGALSSMAAFTLIEVGDALSKNGFSPEDIVADAAGVVFGYLRRRSPTFKRLVDCRVEYWPSETVTKGGRNDLATDYSGYKYLLALKLEGIKPLRSTPLQYLELHFGYYTRGYVNGDEAFFDEATRHAYVGFGINIAHVLRRLGLRKGPGFFEYYQPPKTYISKDWNFDD